MLEQESEQAAAEQQAAAEAAAQALADSKADADKQLQAAQEEAAAQLQQVQEQQESERKKLQAELEAVKVRGAGCHPFSKQVQQSLCLHDYVEGNQSTFRTSAALKLMGLACLACIAAVVNYIGLRRNTAYVFVVRYWCAPN